MIVEIQPPWPLPSITLMDVDFWGISPYNNNPIVIFTVLMVFNVQWILVDGGSLVNVMYLGILLGFVGVETKVRVCVDLETTFGDVGFKKFTIWYLVVNAPSTYNISLMFVSSLRVLLEKVLSTSVLRHIQRWFRTIFEANVVESLDFLRRFPKNCLRKATILRRFFLEK